MENAVTYSKFFSQQKEKAAIRRPAAFLHLGEEQVASSRPPIQGCCQPAITALSDACHYRVRDIVQIPSSALVEQCVDLTGSVVAQELIHEILQRIRWTCEIEARDPSCPHVFKTIEVDLVHLHVGDDLVSKITDLWVRRQVDVHLDFTELTHGEILAPFLNPQYQHKPR